MRQVTDSPRSLEKPNARLVVPMVIGASAQHGPPGSVTDWALTRWIGAASLARAKQPESTRTLRPPTDLSRNFVPRFGANASGFYAVAKITAPSPKPQYGQGVATTLSDSSRTVANLDVIEPADLIAFHIPLDACMVTSNRTCLNNQGRHCGCPARFRSSPARRNEKAAPARAA
jgi:hypothetical protein